MISPKYHKVEFKRVQRASKAHLLVLQHQLKRSKIALDSGSYKKTEQKLKGNIQNLQNQLHDCACSINIEAKKTKVLYELIAIIRGQMFKYQSITKKEDEEQIIKKDKQITKLKSECDLILHKNNEEIAKILKLQDLANGRRSERVVYSNLFKKLEKELKHYEEDYKQSVMASQTSTRNHLDWLRIKNGNLTEIEQKKNNVQIAVKKNYQARFSTTKDNFLEESGWKGFALTNKNSQNETRQLGLNTRKGYVKSFYQAQEKLDSKLGAKFVHTKQLLKKIDQFESVLQRIHVHCEFFKTGEILNHFQGINKKNVELVSDIEDIDNKVSNKTIALDKLLKQIASFESQNTKHLDEQKTQNISYSKIVKNDTQDLEKLHQISLLFGVQVDSIFGLGQSFKEVDEKISLFADSVNLKGTYIAEKQDTMFGQAVVQGMIQKMEKFQNCERILERENFRQEYYKELSKRKVGRVKKESK